MTTNALVAGCLLAGFAGAPALAADLFGSEIGTLIRTDTIAVEANAGVLTGTARENVYNVPGNGAKVSQLDWRTDAAATIGGRISFRPFDWVTVRARGWVSIDSDGGMKDYDWLAGYFGKNSWTDYSSSPNTKLASAWQADASVALRIWGDDELALTGIAGYRFLTMKWNALGGSFTYSVNGFRDTTGSFPADQLGIAYQQWWETPYFGVGAAYNSDRLGVSVELIGSPLVMSRDRDHHALRGLLFLDDNSLGGMFGAAIGAEWRFTPTVSLTGRLEYQTYFEARGKTKIFDGAGLVATVPEPGAGASSETLHLQAGLKVRL